MSIKESIKEAHEKFNILYANFVECDHNHSFFSKRNENAALFYRISGLISHLDKQLNKEIK
jgi:hypothetical protein